jgi:hypothetical protein
MGLLDPSANVEDTSMLAAMPQLDLARLASALTVNYMHYANALDVWPELLPAGEERVTKRAFLKHLHSGSAVVPELEKFIRRRLRWYKEKVTFNQLRQALQESAEWREQFHALGCRGFSYKLDLNMSGYNSRYPREFRLGSRINLRMALLTGKTLFYPSRVNSHFRCKWDNHYFHEKMPSIAFCFGMKTDRAWYIFVMQSDLATRGPSNVRDHFRGWRKILFANVVAQARGKVDALYLCRAEDAVRACFRLTKEKPGRVSQRWRSIYDLTAEQWGMRLVKYFYELPLVRTKETNWSDQEALCIEIP